ncbi:MAG: PDZ domain-containing protein [Okeania sp. SIO3B5]|uniref:PDZ domain-containing protein n=1 Tax=Okeania sp. SIO3B5 TaxID=2607811 RepID=UPI0013FF9F88|nr:PDZ domain-containing protein [Okeania sp. SIO3B5]NEO53527.1 PDZ domain-containing protein [Okeania sp. SIO3B5]
MSKPSECEICGANDFKIIEEKKDLFREVKTSIPSEKKPKKTFKPPTFTKPSPPSSKVTKKPESIVRLKAPVSDSKAIYSRSTSSYSRHRSTTPSRIKHLPTRHRIARFKIKNLSILIAGLSMVGLTIWGIIIIMPTMVSWFKNLQTPPKVERTVLDENFTKPSSRWSIGEFAKFKDGGLFQQVSKPNRGYWNSWDANYLPYNIQKTDYSADLTKINSPDNEAYGILTRIRGNNDQNYYYLLITSNGYFSMGKHSKENWENKINWKEDNSINQGNGLNRLRVVTEGNLITGFINGKEVGNFKDNSYKSGNIGVYSESGKQGNGVAVNFDNIKVIATVFPFLGIQMNDITPELKKKINQSNNSFKLSQDKGVIITNIYPKSPANKSGLKVGDIFHKIDGTLIKDTTEVQEKIKSSKIGEQIKIEVIRNDKKEKIKAILEPYLIPEN